MLGLIIGAIFVQWATWSWVFWFVALVCMPIAVLCIFLIPKQEPKVDDIAIRRGARWNLICVDHDFEGVRLGLIWHVIVFVVDPIIIVTITVTTATSSASSSSTITIPRSSSRPSAAAACSASIAAAS